MRSVGRVSDALWARLNRAIIHSRRADFFLGVAGTLPILALVAPTRGEAGWRVTEIAQRRVTRTLRTMLASAARGERPQLGLAHGIAGLLCAYEMGNRLLESTDTSLRAPAIDVLARSANRDHGIAIWPLTANTPQTQQDMHAICNGGPGIGLAALLALRYSQDAAYGPLIDLALSSTAVKSVNDSFCCGTIGRVEVVIEAFRTTGDDDFLAVAKELFASVDPTTLIGESWKYGQWGYRFTELRLKSPMQLDLPGFPLELTPLAAPRS